MYILYFLPTTSIYFFEYNNCFPQKQANKTSPPIPIKSYTSSKFSNAFLNFFFFFLMVPDNILWSKLESPEFLITSVAVVFWGLSLSIILVPSFIGWYHWKTFFSMFLNELLTLQSWINGSGQINAVLYTMLDWIVIQPVIPVYILWIILWIISNVDLSLTSLWCLS